MLNDQLSTVQLNEWEAYDRLDPIGTWRDDFRMAYLSMIVTNLVKAIYGKEEDKPTVPIDFMPDWAKGEEEIKEEGQSVEEMKQILMGIAKASKKRKPHSDIQKQTMVKNRKK